jgi:hypothetical protein
MFKGNRVIAQGVGGRGKLEWYFQAREGLIGPYGSEEKAAEALKRFVEHRVRLGLDGGRSRRSADPPFDRV